MEACGGGDVVSGGEWGATTVPRDYVKRCWGVLAPLVERACRYSGGRFTPEGVYARVMGEHPSGAEWEMWAAVCDGEVRAIGCTQLLTYSDTGLRALEFVLLGGDSMEAWARLEPEMAAYAKHHACERIEAAGRRGFQRNLPHWRTVLYLMELDLTEAAGPRGGSVREPEHAG